jgi:hypothetical protein
MGLDKAFWAHVRTLSQTIGYTMRGVVGARVKAPTFQDVVAAMDYNTLLSDHLVAPDGVSPSDSAQTLLAYFAYRAEVLNTFVQHQLQTRDEAEAMYLRILRQYPSRRPASKNKQTGDKATVAFLTAIVNLLIEAHSQGIDYDHNPMQLTTITQNGRPLRTLARRVDGAFPSVVNPVAIWEIKEYYNTTTFGSRVADGVYETMLDGAELEEMRMNTGVHVEHLLIVDAKFTWWDTSGGPAYLCRIVDMLHMGYVDEVLFGKEIEQRLPALVPLWAEQVRRQQQALGADGPRSHGQTPII